MPGQKNERLWSRAKRLTTKQYGTEKDLGKRYWKIVQGTYQNMMGARKALMSLPVGTRAELRKHIGSVVGPGEVADWLVNHASELWHQKVKKVDTGDRDDIKAVAVKCLETAFKVMSMHNPDAGDTPDAKERWVQQRVLRQLKRWGSSGRLWRSLRQKKPIRLRVQDAGHRVTKRARDAARRRGDKGVVVFKSTQGAWLPW